MELFLRWAFWPQGLLFPKFSIHPQYFFVIKNIFGSRFLYLMFSDNELIFSVLWISRLSSVVFHWNLFFHRLLRRCPHSPETFWVFLFPQTSFTILIKSYEETVFEKCLSSSGVFSTLVDPMGNSVDLSTLESLLYAVTTILYSGTICT